MIDNNEEAMLVGYVRKSLQKAALKISINKQAFEECEIYTTADGQQYVSLVVSLSAVSKVLDGERAVTTISQIIRRGE